MKNQKPSAQNLLGQLDLFTTLFPFLSIVALCFLFVLFPDQSSKQLERIRFFLGDQLGCYYLLIGLGVFLVSLYLCFSPYGSIRLGDTKKPQYSGFRWGSMMFTAGLAADILFYSCCEWLIYASDPYVSGRDSVYDWAAAYPLFHWGPVPWGFYLVLAVAFGFMLHVRKQKKQKYSEACRPLLGKWVDGWAGRMIDLTAVFALLAGTATTFSLATPLLSMAISRVTGLAATSSLTIGILIAVCCVYTCSVYFGMKGIQRSAACCIYLFFLLLAYVFFLGGETRFIVETGITSLGLVAQNFITLCTWTDPMRTTSFPQTMTIFYWAYWMVWCVAAPFFIGTISKGRTIKQTILGGYFWGLAGTFTSFIILGNYGLGLQIHGRLDSLSGYMAMGGSNTALYSAILSILDQLPLSGFVMILLVLCMITFYSTSFDSITLVAASYSYRELNHDQDPDRRVKLFWAVFLILLPIALIFSEKSMANLQSVSIIAAFPVGLIMILIIVSFFKDAGNYLKEKT
ncbi:BCCT family transporter [Clostridiaceae bacterium]|nr:BCCT family transporter [Clostridiaceae bacterium]